MSDDEGIADDLEVVEEEVLEDEDEDVDVEDEPENEDDLSEYGAEESVNDDDETVDELLQTEEEMINPYQSKFNDANKQNYLQQFHPEEIHKPFEEIYKLSLITRDENGMIIDDLHKTYPILSKYEKAKILGLRVSQLNKGAEPYVTIKHSILDNILIAEKELKEKKIPFIIMRPIPNGKAEYWNVNDLENL
jgi:DNA-directed RNA polymerase I, II, and III subunit RPABC2